MEEEKREKEENQLETLLAFSNMMGVAEGKNEINMAEMAKAIELAKKVGTVMRSLQEEEETEMMPSGKEGDYFDFRQTRMLRAAIPFLDKEYQKNLYILVKLLEAKKIQDTDTLMIQSRQSPPRRVSDRRGDMLRAMRPFCGDEEQKSIDMILKVMRMKKMLTYLEKGGL